MMLVRSTAVLCVLLSTCVTPSESQAIGFFNICNFDCLKRLNTCYSNCPPPTGEFTTPSYERCRDKCTAAFTVCYKRQRTCDESPGSYIDIPGIRDRRRETIETIAICYADILKCNDETAGEFWGY